VSKASQLRQRAQTFLKKGKIGEAVDAYKKLLQVESRNPNLYNELGDIYLRAEDRMQAVMSFEKAVENYEKVALYNNAVAVCKKMLRVVPNRLETIFKLGELKAKQKYNGDASRMFAQYLDMATETEGGIAAENIFAKIEVILALVPDDDDLHAKAAEVLTYVGLKISSAEVIARLIVRSVSNGDSEKTDLYRGKLDLLRESLSADEQNRIEEILAGSLEFEGDGDETEAEPDLTVEEIDTTAAAESVGSDKEATGDGAVPGAADVEQQPEPEAVKAVDEVTPAPAEETQKEEKIFDIDSQPADDQSFVEETLDESEAAAGEGFEAPGAADTEQADDIEVPVAAGQEDVANGDQDTEQVQTDAGATPAEDELSDILDAEDAANDAAADETDIDAKNLAEEITSDVEEDDFRSHYDLGMAYIEMALYNEAIKELQISARSEQLQLRSLEMIGNCFLLMENPRLAVKQLNRGLELATNTGGDNLGIHYNLGLAYEALNEPGKAREHFEEVYIVDVTFRDISEKMKKYSTVS
jgi:tetratricopeptide (TPR) repeat protein